jgi:hypothetical protein
VGGIVGCYTAMMLPVLRQEVQQQKYSVNVHLARNSDSTQEKQDVI